MRIVASFDDENLASRFSIFLKKEDIENDIEENVDKDTQKLQYSIWVHNEDVLDKAIKHFQFFLENPKDSKYDVKIEKPIEKDKDPKDSKYDVKIEKPIEKDKDPK
ncbi:MAG: hypothetical protein K1060chlam1_01449, partial [Candidatus Anoxychlamydiales bacterium]|nr:hypothetical protein [Candidatus Anoxychlamydiales bacterium]